MTDNSSSINSNTPSSVSSSQQVTPSTDSAEQNNNVTSSSSSSTSSQEEESTLSDKDQKIIDMYLNSPYVQAHGLEDEILDNTDEVLKRTDASKKISSHTKEGVKKANESTEDSLDAAAPPELPEAKYQ